MYSSLLCGCCCCSGITGKRWRCNRHIVTGLRGSCWLFRCRCGLFSAHRCCRAADGCWGFSRQLILGARQPIAELRNLVQHCRHVVLHSTAVALGHPCLIDSCPSSPLADQSTSWIWAEAAAGSNARSVAPKPARLKICHAFMHAIPSLRQKASHDTWLVRHGLLTRCTGRLGAVCGLGSQSDV